MTATTEIVRKILTRTLRGLKLEGSVNPSRLALALRSRIRRDESLVHDAYAYEARLLGKALGIHHTHGSTTDGDARLYRKNVGQAAPLV